MLLCIFMASFSLHEEVLAQRALDRRLTEELTRFKTSITLLTRLVPFLLIFFKDYPFDE